MLPDGRIRQWIPAVKRKDWKLTKHTRFCGEHFTTGKKQLLCRCAGHSIMTVCVLYQTCAPLKPHLTYQYLYTSTGKPVDEPSHVDYVPSVCAYKPSLAEAVNRQKIECQERAGSRRQLAQEQAVETQRRTTAAEALMFTTAETQSNSSTQTLKHS